VDIIYLLAKLTHPLTFALFFLKKKSYDEIVKEHKVAYVAGGAAQNAARGAAVCPFHSFATLPCINNSQYVLPPDSVVYTGCVGDDDLAQQLRAANKREGLAEAYLVEKGEQTGACAVVITGHHRCPIPVYLTPYSLANHP
jgi:adenosine kinase